MSANKGKKRNGYLSDYVVFDLETTGINAQKDKIIEISAVRVTNHEKTGEYSTLVNPKRKIPAAATAVNGITNEMVAKAPDIREALQGFLEFIGDSVLVGHNIHSFDMKFIYGAAENEWGREIPNDYIDTLFLARTCLPELSHHRLTDVSAHFQIATEGAHRALNDCIMNMQCYEELGKIYERMQAERAARRKAAGNGAAADAHEGESEAGTVICPECGEPMVRRKGKFGEFYGCSDFPRCRGTRRV